MERLRVNSGRYGGECIEIDAVLADIHAAASKSGWEQLPIIISQAEQLPAYRLGSRGRSPSQNIRKIYISAGIHGDEPAGPLAALKLFQDADWPADTEIWFVSCLNPAGFKLNCRGDAEGIDLNRDYRDLKTSIVRGHIKWLEDRPRFDFSLLLHEDWESEGFYLYELNPKNLPSLAETIVEAAGKVCPIDRSPLIEGREASGGIINANRYLKERPDWPEAFYLIHHKTPVSYTLESPSDFPLATRVAALVAGVRAALGQ